MYQVKEMPENSIKNLLFQLNDPMDYIHTLVTATSSPCQRHWNRLKTKPNLENQLVPKIKQIYLILKKRKYCRLMNN